MKLLSTGDLAARCGVSADTIRHYEKHGLLATAPRTEKGYRLFPAEAVERVQVIRQALRVGFTIEELTKILRRRAAGEAPCRNVRALAAAKLTALDEAIEQMTVLRAQLAATLHDWDSRLAAVTDGSPAFLLDSLLHKENDDEDSDAASHPRGFDSVAGRRLSASRRARR
jgi:DNA-binding transcriptional MerR regulator